MPQRSEAPGRRVSHPTRQPGRWSPGFSASALAPEDEGLMGGSSGRSLPPPQRGAAGSVHRKMSVSLEERGPPTQIQGLCRLQGDRRPVGVWGRDRRMSLSLTLVSEASVKGPCPQPSPGSRLGTESTAPCYLALAQSLHSWAACRESGRALGVKARSCWWSCQAGPPCFKTDAEATGEKWPSG